MNMKKYIPFISLIIFSTTALNCRQHDFADESSPPASGNKVHLSVKNEDSLIKKTEIPKDPPIKDTHDWLLPEDKD